VCVYTHFNTNCNILQYTAIHIAIHTAIHTATQTNQTSALIIVKFSNCCTAFQTVTAPDCNTHSNTHCNTHCITHYNLLQHTLKYKLQHRRIRGVLITV